LRRRLANRFMLRTSYVLSWSNSWGGRPTASYSGNAIAITPERQFIESEFGPTIFDERHRFVISGFFQLPWGFEVTPLFQASSSRPVNNRSGIDNDGDGRIDLDRLCVDGTVTNGCEMVEVNPLRGDPFVQLDLRTAKRFDIGERASIRAFWELFNLFDRDNFCNNFGNNQNSPSTFLQPLGYCGGQGFGGAFSGPMRSQFGLRFEF
jgi:hypothetical protein